MSYRITKFYGAFLIFLGLCMFPCLLTAVLHEETSSAEAFSLTMIICMIPGLCIYYMTKGRFSDFELRMRDSYFIVATAWLIASALGALPYVISGSIPHYIDAFFETASGFTTTGATIMNDVEANPRSILLWRSLTQWLGGMGIIVLFMALLPTFGIKARNIAKAETPGISVTRLTSRYSGTAQRLYVIYIGLTLILTVLLMFGGLDLYDAVNHALATMATGGFSTYNDSIGHFHSNYISWVITIFMFIAGTNFELFFMVLGRHIRKALANEEFRFYCIIVSAATVSVALSLIIQDGYSSIWQAFTDSAFQVSTIISTTGFATSDFDLWPTFCQMVLLILMVTGGCSSSTSGGVKLVRVLMLFKMIKREVRIKLHGSIIRDVSLDGRKLLPETVTYLIGFVSMYFVTLMLSTFLISLAGDGNLVSNVTASLSCISNVGPGFDSVGPVCNYDFYSGFSKFILSMVMIAGRLELSTFFILFSRFFWFPGRV